MDLEFEKGFEISLSKTEFVKQFVSFSCSFCEFSLPFLKLFLVLIFVKESCQRKHEFVTNLAVFLYDEMHLKRAINSPIFFINLKNQGVYRIARWCLNDVLCSLPQNPWPAQYYGQYSLSHHTLLSYQGKKHITLFFNREIYLQGLSGLVFSRVVDSACKSCQEKQKHVKNRGNIKL